MTPHPDFAVGPVSADSPEQTYQLAIDTAKAIQDLRGPSPALKDDMAMAATELLHNAADHSRPDPGRPWAVHLQLIHEPAHPRYLLQVCDTGQGINEALNGPGNTVADHHAVLEATRPGVTSSGDPDRGQGLHLVMQTAQPEGRTLTITSAKAFLMVHEDGKLELGLAPGYPGTMVAATFPTQSQDSPAPGHSM